MDVGPAQIQAAQGIGGTLGFALGVVQSGQRQIAGQFFARHPLSNLQSVCEAGARPHPTHSSPAGRSPSPDRARRERASPGRDAQNVPHSFASSAGKKPPRLAACPGQTGRGHDDIRPPRPQNSFHRSGPLPPRTRIVVRLLQHRCGPGGRSRCPAGWRNGTRYPRRGRRSYASWPRSVRACGSACRRGIIIRR